jgi:uncharacterized protein YjeT (DUF2065 family)
MESKASGRRPACASSTMNWNDLLAAIALYLVIEGLLPFASPSGWRQGLVMIARLPDAQLRLVGLSSIAAGLMLLWFVRG